MATTVDTLPPKHRPDRSNVIPGVATLMVLVAVSLGVASALHLSGLVHGRSASFDPDAAGIAEAVIGLVLAAAAIVMFMTPVRARAVGIAATSFALVGFLVGIIETATGGDVPDIAYHSTVIPLLIGGLVLLIRPSRAAPLPET
jgi:hypothetical protein